VNPPRLEVIRGGRDFSRPTGATPSPKVLEEAPVLMCRECHAALWAYREEGRLITQEHVCVRPPVPLARCSLCDEAVPSVATPSGAVRVDPHACRRSGRGLGWAWSIALAVALWAAALATWRAIW
jgi:hypothetical protein